MKVNKEQAIHFNKTAHFYQCPPEEVVEMKAAYERDPESAAICFAEMAAHVDLVVAQVAEHERALTGEQFLKLGRLAREMEAMRDAE